MTKTFCDRDGVLIVSAGYSLTWFNGRAVVTSDLCGPCHEALRVWFGQGNPAAEVVTIAPADLQSASVRAQTGPSTP